MTIPKIPLNWQKLIGNGGLVIALSTLLTFIINYKGEQRNDFQIIIDRQNELLEEYSLENRRLNTRLKILEDRVSILSSVAYESPVATWFKDLNGRMVTLNKSYELYFLFPNGKTITDYIGKTDEEFWGSLGQAELGKRYASHDRKIVESKQTRRFEEQIFIKGKKYKAIVYKYPVFSDAPEFTRPQLIGVGGVAVIVDPINL